MSPGIANILLRFRPQNQGDDGRQETKAREQSENTEPQSRGGQSFGLRPHIDVVVPGVVGGSPAADWLGKTGEFLGDLVFPPRGADTPVTGRFRVVPVVDVVVVLLVLGAVPVVGIALFPTPPAVVVLVSSVAAILRVVVVVVVVAVVVSVSS